MPLSREDLRISNGRGGYKVSELLTANELTSKIEGLREASRSEYNMFISQNVKLYLLKLVHLLSLNVLIFSTMSSSMLLCMVAIVTVYVLCYY